MSVLTTTNKQAAVIYGPPTLAIACGGCGQPPNHTHAHAIRKEIIHCPRCDREVARPIDLQTAVRDWNRINR